MFRGFKILAFLVVLGVFLVPWAHAENLSAEYLYGRWVVDDQNCSSSSAEIYEFRKNGTFECTRSGRTEIVGFWGLKEGILELHMVTSAGFYDDIHKALASFEGIYSYFQAKMIIFNTKKQSFEAFGVLGDEIKRATAVRCQ
ncbi:MAG: hypothetical protein JRK53_18995 [Deltaproteobacteria bacterium]|nr:hypothetical protein [Deltaproteobacteria bacterium]